MFSRLTVIIAFTLLPTFVLAADAVVQPSGQAPQLQSQATGAAPAAGGSTADAGALQPANGANLGASPTASSGLVAPVADPLQAPATNDAALHVLLSNEADGGQHQTEASTDSEPESWLNGVLLGGLLVLGLVGWTMNRRQLAHARSYYPPRSI